MGLKEFTGRAFSIGHWLNPVRVKGALQIRKYLQLAEWDNEGVSDFETSGNTIPDGALLIKKEISGDTELFFKNSRGLDKVVTESYSLGYFRTLLLKANKDSPEPAPTSLSLSLGPGDAVNFLAIKHTQSFNIRVSVQSNMSGGFSTVLDNIPIVAGVWKRLNISDLMITNDISQTDFIAVNILGTAGQSVEGMLMYAGVMSGPDYLNPILQ